MRVRFWGTRGSLPAPLNAAEVEAKIRRAIRAIWEMPEVDTTDVDEVLARVGTLSLPLRGTVGGHTSCVELQAGDEIFVIDAGSGLQPLGRALMQGPCGEGRCTVHMFFSHCHWDHLIGFPMFVPAFVPGNHLILYGVHDVRRSLERQLNPENWPIDLDYMAADKTFVTLEPGSSRQIGNVHVDVLKNPHPGDSYSYRFEDEHSTLVYASDVEFKHLDEAGVRPHRDFFHGADALVFDAQYTLREVWKKADFGHSSALIGVDLARAAGVKRLLLYHHDPTYADADLQEIQDTATAYQAQDPSRPLCEVLVAYDGLALDLTPADVADVQVTSDGDAAIFTPTRVFDELGVDRLAEELAELAEQNPSSIVDLSHVQTLTTAGLQALMRLRQARRGAPIVLVAPSENVRRVADLAGYLDYFTIYPSVDVALAAVKAREGLHLPGQVLLGRYQIEGKIGEGELGAVLKAFDVQDQRKVALKVLFPYFSQDMIDRFTHQAQQIIALDHPHIVPVLAWEKEANYSFKVEAYMSSPTLQSYLALHAGPLPIDEAMHIALDISQALEYAHSRGVVHGDLKPSNVFMTPSGARVSGFGQGRLEEGHNLLRMPFFFMDPLYVAPEQILGQPLDARTDLYALGVLLYRLFTGRFPFERGEEDLLQAHLHRAPPPPRQFNPQISLSLEHLLLKLLSKNPNDRYASARQTWRISQNLMTHGEDAGHPRRVLLVGRVEERQRLRNYWDEAAAGRGQLVFISGEPGVGKTSLAQQVATQCQPPVLLTGQAREGQTTASYRLFAEVLRAYFATVPPEFHDAEARRLLGNLRRLVPEIGQMLPDLPTPIALDAEQEQLRIMATLTQFIKRATRDRPWLLILDDLQWADAMSLELLRYLGRHVHNMPLLLIGTYCESELESGLLRDVLADLSGLPVYHQVVLDRLSLEDVDQLLSYIWRQPVPEDLVRRIYQQTEGNPFYVEEVAQGLVDDGQVARRDGAWQFPEVARVRLPQSVRDAVWRRIGRLSPDALSLLSRAAVLGEVFDVGDLQEMADLSRWEVLEHLSVALERNLVQEGPGESQLSFRHTEIQYVLYDDLGSLRRRVLHRQAAEALERRAQPEPEQVAEALAHHFGGAGMEGKAVVYSVEAARQAETARAYLAALSWYRRALNHLEALDSEAAASYDEVQFAVHRALGDILTHLARYEEALEQYTAAEALLDAQGPAPEDGQARAQACAQARAQARACRYAALCYAVAQVHERSSGYDLAVRWLERGMGYVDAGPPTEELTRLNALCGRVRLQQGKTEAALRCLNRALRMAREISLREVEAEALQSLAATQWRLGDVTEALQIAERALRIQQEIGDRAGESRSLNLLGILATDRGNYDDARAYLTQTLELRRQVGDLSGESATLNNLGVVSWSCGDLDGAYTYYEQALRLYREIGHTVRESRSLNNLGLVLHGRGDYLQARDHYEQALRTYRELGDRWGEASSLANLGRLYRTLGAWEEAEARLQEALEVRRAIGNRAGEVEALAFLALVAHAQEDDTRAQTQAEQALDIAQALGDRPAQGRAWMSLGHACRGLGQLDRATSAYAAALDLRRTLGEHGRAVEGMAGLAAVALAQDDLDGAREHITPILAYLQQAPALGSAEDPFWVYLTVHQVLRAQADPAAAEVLETAYRMLTARAAEIDDAALRASFLERVPAHRELMALHDEG